VTFFRASRVKRPLRFAQPRLPGKKMTKEEYGCYRRSFLIGVGKPHWIAAPLPPNRTCRSPASGSPVSGLTSRRIGEPSMSRFQTEQPCLGKEGIWPPLLLVCSVTTDPLEL